MLTVILSGFILGADLLSPVFNQTARICIGYHIGGLWSVEGEVGMNLKNAFRWKENSEYKEHQAGLSDVIPEEVRFRETFIDLSITASYWPEDICRGPCFSIGYRYRDREGPDCCIGAGYAFRIWKGLTGLIAYRTGVAEIYKKQKMPPEGIRLCLYYAF